LDREHKRILDSYERLEGRVQAGPRFFGYENLAHVYRVNQRHQETQRLLSACAFHPLTDVRILDVGCGNGNMLRQFLQWRATPSHLAGIELRAEPIEQARALNPGIDIRCGSAIEMPWENESFDLVCQHTVFTSILDDTMKRQIAAEMNRVLRPGGAVLWYDFFLNNPGNRDVKGIGKHELYSLFPQYKINLRKISLAPPIARRIPERLLPVVYPALAAIPLLRTHYLALCQKPGTKSAH
jgi:SAM-dependent methyltransferase